ncbi:Ig-like domain-containing protein [Sinomonas sp. P10A9]|uniref:Ig-like domain-containing protein n=1 Tax=Sinomonas puerhi TaxID=3238584 RepID=A0AB39L5M9_9MICC
MNSELRQRLYAEAAALAARHPADIDSAVARGRSRLRARLMALSIIAVVAVLAAAAALIAVRLVGPAGGQASVIGVAVSAPNSSVAIGDAVQTTATAALSDGGTRQLTDGVTWSSSDPAALTVDDNGLVRAHHAGSARISARFGSFSGSLVLTGTQGPASALPTVDKLQVDPSTLTVKAGTKGTLSSHFVLSDGSTASPPRVEWASSDPTVGTVQAQPDGQAVGTALKAGTVTVTATAQDASGKAFTATATISVLPPDVLRVEVSPAQPPQMSVGGPPAQFTATVTYSDGTKAPSDLVAWSVNDTNIVRMDSKGQAFPVEAGTTWITAEIGGTTSQHVTITVKGIG